MYRRIVASVIFAVVLTSSSAFAAPKTDPYNWFDRIIQRIIKIVHPLDTIDPTPPKP